MQIYLIHKKCDVMMIELSIKMHVFVLSIIYYDFFWMNDGYE